MNKKTLIILVSIVILASLLRFPFLSRFPAGFTADEAAQGYTAYSILKTGRDEWGARLPLTPRSFGDFKPPLYTYLTIPSIAIFGLSEFSVRLPAAILGVLAILATYLLATKIFSREKKFSIFHFQFSIGEIAALLLTISPWHLGFSRSAVEANLTAFFFPLGLYFYLKGRRYFPFAALFWGLNLYTYHSARLFTLVFVFFIIWWNRRKLLSLNREVFIAGLLAAILILPVLVGVISKGGGKRFLDVSIFNPTDRWEEVSQRQFESSLPFPLSRVFNNKATWVINKFTKNYLSYFSLTFLFTEGSPDTSYANFPGRGLLYLWELPLLLAAIYFFYKRKEKMSFPLLLWLFLAALPAALSKESLHANRASTFLPLWSILSAYGAFFSWDYLSKHLPGVARKVTLFCCFGVMLFSSVFFLEDYFFHAPFKFAKGLSYGYKETINYLSEIEDDYDKIVMTKRFSEPQTFVAFYKKYDPLKYQTASQDFLRYEKEGWIFLDQLGTYRLGKYEFRDLNWGADKELQKTLIVGGAKDFVIEKVIAKKTVYYPNGEVAFLIVDPVTQPKDEK